MANIITACIAAVSAIIVSIFNNISQMNKIRDEQRETFNKFSAETGKALALTDERLKNLTDEMKKHNSVIERTYKLEQNQAVIQMEIRDIQKEISKD